MDIQDPSQPSLAPVPKPHNQNISITAKVLILTVILSLVFGSFAGALGSFYLLKSVEGQKLLANSNNPANGQKITLQEDSSIIDVVKKTSPAVVSIVVSQDLSKIPGYGMNPYSQDPFYNFYFGGGQSQQQTPSAPNVQEVAAGSGFFVSANGLILTNKHVVSDSGASYTVLTSDGKTYDAKVVAQDPVDDLAIVKINITNAPFLQFGDSGKIQIGQEVIAIGNSLGQYQNTVTSGIISGIGRSITAGSDGGSGSEDLSGVIQTDAAINPGNSGGPLLDILGNVIGINTAIDEQGQLVGFAIPSSEAAKALASFQKNGKIVRPFLGVRYISITDAIAKQQNLPESYGALIVRGDTNMDFAVQPGSPADKAGLMENDIILSVNGQKLNDKDNTLPDILKNYNPGDTVSLEVYHQGKTKTVQVTLAQTPNN